MDRPIELAILKAGDTLASVKAAFGDFDAMFVEPLRALGVETRVVQVHRGEPLPDLDACDGVIVTGSPHSVIEREPWAEALASHVRALVGRERPFFGVCYGHQILAHAMGGRVDRNPNGYEVGTIEVALTAAAAEDPLLGALDGAGGLAFQSTHQDAVVEAPPGSVLLASNALTPVQAFRVGRRAWGVQFHPEFTDGIMRLYVEGRAPLIRANAERLGREAEVEVARVAENIRATPLGPRLLARFVAEARANARPA